MRCDLHEQPFLTWPAHGDDDIEKSGAAPGGLYQAEQDRIGIQNLAIVTLKTITPGLKNDRSPRQ